MKVGPQRHERRDEPQAVHPSALEEVEQVEHHGAERERDHLGARAPEDGRRRRRERQGGEADRDAPARGEVDDPHADRGEQRGVDRKPDAPRLAASSPERGERPIEAEHHELHPPAVVDPRAARDREREGVGVGNHAVGENVVGRAQVPPGVRVGRDARREGE